MASASDEMLCLSLIARLADYNIRRVPPPPLAVAPCPSETSVVREPVVPSEFFAHVRAVTAELRELIPTVASVAGRARALLDADVFDTIVDDRELGHQMTAAGLTDLADIAELLAALLNLSEPLAGEVLVDLMDYLDHDQRS
jgi:hypothetical protein